MGLIYLDSCVLIYAAEKDGQWGDRSRAAIAGHRNDDLAISPLVKLECLVGPSKKGDTAAERLFSQFFQQFMQLEIPEAVYLLAARLRAHHGLKTPDALHLACAQHHRCDALWTNDGRFSKASHGLARNIFAP